MANPNWESLNAMQIGKYAEYYAKMEFMLHGFDIFSPEVDYRGVDFIARNGTNDYYEVQVKSLRESSKSKYVFIKEQKMHISNSKFVVCFIYFYHNSPPKAYLLKAAEWETPTIVLRKNTGEFGINITQKGLAYLDKNFSFNKVVGQLI